MSGESDKEIFAFVDYAKGKKSTRESEWEMRGVTPILYAECEKPSKYKGHDYLHGTLKSWADIYQDGVRGKERIVSRYAKENPSLSTSEDDFVGRMLWALSDPGGLPAKCFAERERVPSLDWLDVFCVNRYGMEDLDCFGMARPLVHDDQNHTLRFSFLRRPVSSHDHRPRMALVNPGGADSVALDNIMRQLGGWLARHLNNPKLLFWVAKQGGCLHSEFAKVVARRLDEIDELEHTGNHDEIKRIQTHAPDAIPSPRMRDYWRLAVTGRLSRQDLFLDFYFWRDQFQRDGLTPSIRIRLCEMLKPRISLQDYGRLVPVQDTEEPARCIHPEIALYDIRDMFEEDQQWQEALPDLMEDASMLLREALDLMRELGEADDKRDWMYIQMPSISDRLQNRYADEWTILITLCRDAWLATAETNPAKARLAAERWWQVSYPIFKRLALFAAAQDDIIPVELALDWLTAKNGRWLWSRETMCEAMELAGKLQGSNLARIEQAILQGPPRDMHEEVTQEEHWNDIVGRSIWRQLAKLKEAGAVLHPDARAKLEMLVEQYDEREESPPEENRVSNDDWNWRCQNDFPTAADELCALAKENIWPSDRWQPALSIWSQEGPDSLTKRSWRYLAPVLTKAPDNLVQSADYAISQWLESVVAVFDQHEEPFTTLCGRVLKVNSQKGNDDDETDDVDDLPTEAINHPVGKVTEALLRWWGRQPLEDGQGLSGDLRKIFTDLCNPDVTKFRHGRVLLAGRAITLFRVDRKWTTKHLLPLFDWRCPSEARATWQGFLLWSPRLYRPLMEEIKRHFLTTVQHYNKLGRWSEQYSVLLAITALKQSDIFDRGDLAKATASLPPEGLDQTANTLVRALESVDEPQRADYWKNRMWPCLEAAWPQSRRHATRNISICFARLCVASHGKFPKAIEKLDWWLQRLPSQGSAIKDLHKAGLCQKFPAEALRFLDKTVSDDYYWFDELRNCLQSIRRAEPNLAADPELQRQFQRLENILRRRGIELD